MKNLIMIASLFSMLFQRCTGPVKSKPMDAENESKSSIYEIPLKTIDGKDFDLSTLKGKKILIVNTASQCGFTYQYDDLQKLHEKFGDKVAVLGFPANNFGGQEPGSNEQIQGFCKKNYGVTFQMFNKVSVKGSDIHPLFKWLSTKEMNGWNDKTPSWNFCKYLVSENGELLKFYSSSVKPLDPEITNAIQN
ncbi:MAG: glutathione peroxidase [Cytophagales bacterium]